MQRCKELGSKHKEKALCCKTQHRAVLNIVVGRNVRDPSKVQHCHQQGGVLQHVTSSRHLVSGRDDRTGINDLPCTNVVQLVSNKHMN